MTADLVKALLTALVTASVSAVGLAFSFIARWKVQDMSRQQYQRALQDRIDYAEDRDRLLVALREEMARQTAMTQSLKQRQDELEGQLLNLVTEKLRRDRYISRLQRQCRAAGLMPEPFEDAGGRAS